MEYCADLGHGEIEKLKIQDGLPMAAEVTTKKVKFRFVSSSKSVARCLLGVRQQLRLTVSTEAVTPAQTGAAAFSFANGRLASEEAI